MYPLSLLLLASIPSLQAAPAPAQSFQGHGQLLSFGAGRDEHMQGFSVRGTGGAFTTQEPASEQRGWLGVSLSTDDGAVEVTSVVPDSPAARGQLHEGDRIVSLGDERIGSYDDVIKLLRTHHAGDQLALTISRDVEVHLSDDHKDGDRYLLGVYLAEAQGNKSDKAKDKNKDKDDAAKGNAQAGATVTRTSPGYPAAGAGLQAGDVVLSVEGKSVKDSDSVIAALSGVDSARDVTLRILRKRDVTLGSVPGQNVQPFERFDRTPTAPRAGVPPIAQPAPNAAPEGLEEELRALSQELRELREQVSRLRSQIERLKER